MCKLVSVSVVDTHADAVYPKLIDKCILFLCSGRQVAQFFVNYRYIDGVEYVSFQSVKYHDRGWFLIYRDDGKFRGGVPYDDNELFEVVPLGNGMAVALKVPKPVNPEPADASSGSGDSGISTTPECYLGFSPDPEDPNRSWRPSCFNSTESPDVRFHLIDTAQK